MICYGWWTSHYFNLACWVSSDRHRAFDNWSDALTKARYDVVDVLSDVRRTGLLAFVSFMVVAIASLVVCRVVWSCSFECNACSNCRAAGFRLTRAFISHSRLMLTRRNGLVSVSKLQRTANLEPSALRHRQKFVTSPFFQNTWFRFRRVC